MPFPKLWVEEKEPGKLANENQRFRDVTQGKDGSLYALTDGGRLYRIARK